MYQSFGVHIGSGWMACGLEKWDEIRKVSSRSSHASLTDCGVGLTSVPNPPSGAGLVSGDGHGHAPQLLGRIAQLRTPAPAGAGVICGLGDGLSYTLGARKVGGGVAQRRFHGREVVQSMKVSGCLQSITARLEHPSISGEEEEDARLPFCRVCGTRRSREKFVLRSLSFGL